MREAWHTVDNLTRMGECTMRDWTLYDGIEINGCVNEGDCITAVGGTGIKPEFYTVYLHHYEGGYEAIRDFKHYKSAVRYANKLSAKHELWILDRVRGEA